jgi:hypothetical protein
MTLLIALLLLQNMNMLNFWTFVPTVILWGIRVCINYSCPTSNH